MSARFKASRIYINVMSAKYIDGYLIRKELNCFCFRYNTYVRSVSIFRLQGIWTVFIFGKHVSFLCMRIYIMNLNTCSFSVNSCSFVHTTTTKWPYFHKFMNIVYISCQIVKDYIVSLVNKENKYEITLIYDHSSQSHVMIESIRYYSFFFYCRNVPHKQNSFMNAVWIYSCFKHQTNLTCNFVYLTNFSANDQEVPNIPSKN